MFLWEYVVAPETTFTIGQNCSTTYHMLSFWFVLKLAPCHVKRNEEWDINGFFSCLILFLWSSWSRAFRKMCWAKLLGAHVLTEMNELVSIRDDFQLWRPWRGVSCSMVSRLPSQETSSSPSWRPAPPGSRWWEVAEEETPSSKSDIKSSIKSEAPQVSTTNEIKVVFKRQKNFVFVSNFLS